MHSMKRSVADGFRSLLEMLFEAAGLIIDTIRTFFSGSAFHSRTRRFRIRFLGRAAKFSRGMDKPLYFCLSVAARIGHFFGNAYKNPDTHDAK